MKTKVTFNFEIFCWDYDDKREIEFILDKETADEMKTFFQNKNWSEHDFSVQFPTYYAKIGAIIDTSLSLDYYESVRGKSLEDPFDMFSEEIQSLSEEDRLNLYRSELTDDGDNDVDIYGDGSEPTSKIYTPTFEDIEDD